MGLSIGEAAAKLGVAPQVLSDLAYRQILRPDRCPKIGGRRWIDPAYMSEVERILRQRGIATRQPDAA